MRSLTVSNTTHNNTHKRKPARMCDLGPFLSGDGKCNFYIPPSYGNSRPAYRSRPWWAFQKYCCRDGSNPMPGLDQRKQGEIVKVCDNCAQLLPDQIMKILKNTIAAPLCISHTSTAVLD